MPSALACSQAWAASDLGTHNHRWEKCYVHCTHDWDLFLPAFEQLRGCTTLTVLVAQVMNFAAVKGHTELALKAWECMEYAILPAAPFPSGESRLVCL